MSLYTTADLIAAIERRSFSPANQRTFTAPEILSLADEVTQTYVLPSILEVQEEFFVAYKDYDITADQAAYDLPARAIGMVAREVHVLNNNNVTNLARTELERIDSHNTTGSGPGCFYLQGNQVILHPTPASTQNTLRIYYFLRPGALVSASDTAVIESINTTLNSIVVSSIPATWTSGVVLDLAKKDGAHEYRAASLASTIITGTTIEFASLPSGLAVGDIVSLEGQSSLVQLPPDYRPVLAMLTAAEIIGLQNQPGAKNTFDKGMFMLKTAQNLITPRVTGEDQIIVPDWY